MQLGKEEPPTSYALVTWELAHIPFRPPRSSPPSTSRAPVSSQSESVVDLSGRDGHGDHLLSFAAIFLVGIVLNFLVLAAIARDLRLRTVTNLFIANVALADILVLLLCVPNDVVVGIFYGTLHVSN
ncbi:unnamed protein product [Darwinula stevensoni]|uniref:G-protein coupled receptors family 1 profile domain-containing protein n=1 Tax=Darwinula stevensoni TaxID=69355 RepID=A0A7R9FRA4_9CRUS|nr:unnamed protein product [Darwinula stevensoni]CAG0901029.1 unnamed protein product [Darwinula stevensoni]